MFDYKKYWQDRYKNGGNSGSGSYGLNAIFKGSFLNDFIVENNLETVLEVGCGDGNNLKEYKIKEYKGLDVSDEAISICKDKFKQDETKSFEKMNYQKENADLVVCFEVLFHIFPREEWEKTINYCLDCAEKFVLLYTFIESPKTKNIHINDFDILDYLKTLESKREDFVFEVNNIKSPTAESKFIIIKKI